MKKLLMLTGALCLVLILTITMAGTVLAKQGVSGLEAYSLALQSVMATAKDGMSQVAVITGQAINAIVELFKFAIE